MNCCGWEHCCGKQNCCGWEHCYGKQSCSGYYYSWKLKEHSSCYYYSRWRNCCGWEHCCGKQNCCGCCCFWKPMVHFSGYCYLKQRHCFCWEHCYGKPQVHSYCCCSLSKKHCSCLEQCCAVQTEYCSGCCSPNRKKCFSTEPRDWCSCFVNCGPVSKAWWCAYWKNALPNGWIAAHSVQLKILLLSSLNWIVLHLCCVRSWKPLTGSCCWELRRVAHSDESLRNLTCWQWLFCLQTFAGRLRCCSWWSWYSLSAHRVVPLHFADQDVNRSSDTLHY